ncbi:MAG TPA: hypothetical protein VGG71_15905 [Chitinophagaceae bacterium]
MAELHVQRKRHNLSWLWALIGVIVIAIGVYLYLHYKNPKQYPVTIKSTSSIRAANDATAKPILS